MADMTSLDDQQLRDGRLAEGLRSLAIELKDDIHLGEEAGRPLIWPAVNIREVLNKAADRIEALTLAKGTSNGR